MKEVYVIIFEAYHHKKDGDDHEEKEVFGVFDTARRGICYLRRFIDEDDEDISYKHHKLTITERKNGYTSAEATRCYESDWEYVTETLSMLPMELNNLRDPESEIIDVYC